MDAGLLAAAAGLKAASCKLETGQDRRLASVDARVRGKLGSRQPSGAGCAG